MLAFFRNRTIVSRIRECKIDRSKFGLSHSNWKDFCVSQWFSSRRDNNNNIYIAVRFAAAVYLYIVWVLELGFMESPDRDYYFIYFPNWMYTFLVFTTLLQIFLAVKMAEEESISLKLLWVALNISHTNILFGCAFFWICVHEPGSLYIGEINTHAIAGIYVLLDLLIQKIPRRPHHFYQPLIVGIVYILFTIIQFCSGFRGREGRLYIYEGLNWQSPGAASGMALGICFGIICFHFLTCAICYVRDRVYGAKQIIKQDEVIMLDEFEFRQEE